MRGTARGWGSVWVVGVGVLAWGTVQAQPPNPQDVEAMRLKMEQMQQEAEQQTEQSLEALKQTNPEAYQQFKAHYERQKKITQIISAFQAQELDAATAAKRLYPLVKAQAEQELATIDAQIAGATKRLEELEQAKHNPELLIQKRIDQLLGRAKPGEEPWGSFSQ